MDRSSGAAVVGGAEAGRGSDGCLTRRCCQVERVFADVFRPGACLAVVVRVVQAWVDRPVVPVMWFQTVKRMIILRR